MTRVFDGWSIKRRTRVRDVLRKALKLIANKKRWTRNTLAVDKRGKHVPNMSKRAVAFCAAGAVYRVGGKVDAVDVLDEIGGKLDIFDVNDMRGHAAVIKRFRKAIAALGK